MITWHIDLNWKKKQGLHFSFFDGPL